MPSRRVEARRWWHDELLTLAVVLLAGLPLLLGRTYFLDDAHGLALPLFAALQRAVHEGRWLVWNPDLFAGYCALGAGQSGTYYPPNLVLLRLLPLVAAFRASYLLHFWLLARGLVGLSRSLGQGVTATGVTALVGLLGGAVAGHHQHHNVIIGMAWTAPMLWLAVLLGRRRDWLPTLWLALAVGLSLLQSHPQYVFMALVATLVVALTAREQLPGRVVLGRLALATAGGVALAFCQVWPLVEYARLYTRPHPGGSFTYLTAGSFEPRDWLRLLQPDLFGSPVTGGWDEPGFVYWETRGFCGLVLLALALARLAAGRLDRAARTGLALVVVALVLLPGRHNPLYGLLVHLPPFSLFRSPGRWVWLWQLGVALLAGGGVARLQERTLSRRAAMLGAAVVVVGLLVGVVAGRPHRADWGAARLAAMLLGLAFTALLIPACRLSARRRQRFLRLALGVGAIELLVSWHSFPLTRPQSLFAQPPRLAEPILVDPQRRLVDLRLTAPATKLTDDVDRLTSNTGLIWGVGYLSGGKEALPPLGHLGVLQDLDESLPNSERLQFLLDRYSVGWVVTSAELRGANLRPVTSIPGARLYENLAARPVAYALPPELADETGVRTFPGQDVRAEPVEVVQAGPEVWRLRTRFTAPRLVVLAQSFHPGWSAFVDGRASPVMLAELLFQATAVPAGQHEVEFRFDNAGVWLGRQLTWVALAGWVVGLLVATRAARRQRISSSASQ